jgi:hypothetical protein
VALLLGVKVAVDLGDGRCGCFLGQGSEAPGADVLDPAQVGHERLELWPLFITDHVGAGCVPVDVGECPLPVFDLGEHGSHVDGHQALLCVG